MKKFLVSVLFGLLFALSNFAHATQQQSSIDTNNLTPAQIAELQQNAAKMVKDNQPESKSAEVRKELSEWGQLGQNMGKAVVGAASEIGVAANQFAQTPLGKVTVAVVVYKIIGKDLIKFFSGLMVLIVGWPVGIYVIAGKWGLDVQYEYKPKFFGLYNKKYTTHVDSNGEILTGKAVLGCVILLASTCTGLGIMF